MALPPREEPTSATLRRRVAFSACCHEGGQLLHLLLGRGAEELGLGILAPRAGIGEVDGEELVALVAVGLEAPDVVDPERARIAVAVHEHHDRRAGVGGLLAARRRCGCWAGCWASAIAGAQRGGTAEQGASCDLRFILPQTSALCWQKPARRRYARFMTICYVDSPVGRLAIEADHDAVTGVRWASPGERDARQGQQPGAEGGGAPARPLLRQEAQALRPAAGQRGHRLPEAGVGDDARHPLRRDRDLWRHGDGAGLGPARRSAWPARRNPIPIIVPCHRVLGSGGKEGGFSGGKGLPTKRQAAGDRGRRPSLVVRTARVLARQPHERARTARAPAEHDCIDLE